MNKIVFRLDNLLLESKQVGIIYHWTSLDSLVNILKSNELKSNINDDYSSIDFRLDKDPSFKIKPHVSFTRTKGKVQGNDHIFALPCALEIDGDKLSNNYKIEPYSMTSDPKIKAGSYVDPEEEEEVYQAEYEERIYSDIKNLNRYIKAIIFDNDIIRLEKKSYKSVLEYVQGLNIPIKYIN